MNPFDSNRAETALADAGVAERYIFDPTLRRIFWLNLIRRQESGDQFRLVWRSRAINEAVRRIIQGS